MINKIAGLRGAVEALKQRYVVGLHHNWHDYNFRYDPLFDFSMAGDGDLVEAQGRDFARIPIDACNFAPACFSLPRSELFWDILYVARAVAFKGIPEFFDCIRALYDAGHKPRVLFICPLSNPVEIPGTPDLRKHFERLFSPQERHRVTFLSIDWDYPFPLDAQSLAFFYRSSRIFFHPAPEERRCRTAAYAWAGRMPVATNKNVASILPGALHRHPFLLSLTRRAPWRRRWWQPWKATGNSTPIGKPHRRNSQPIHPPSEWRRSCNNWRGNMAGVRCRMRPSIPAVSISGWDGTTASPLARTESTSRCPSFAKAWPRYRTESCVPSARVRIQSSYCLSPAPLRRRRKQKHARLWTHPSCAH